MDRISKLTKNVLVDKNLNKAANAALICHEAFKVFQDFFDKEFLKEIKIISTRDDCLYLCTVNGTYSQEIVLKEKEIIEAINRLLPNRQIKKIRFKNKTKEY